MIRVLYCFRPLLGLTLCLPANLTLPLNLTFDRFKYRIHIWCTYFLGQALSMISVFTIFWPWAWPCDPGQPYQRHGFQGNLGGFLWVNNLNWKSSFFYGFLNSSLPLGHDQEILLFELHKVSVDVLPGSNHQFPRIQGAVSSKFCTDMHVAHKFVPVSILCHHMYFLARPFIQQVLRSNTDHEQSLLKHFCFFFQNVPSTTVTQFG